MSTAVVVLTESQLEALLERAAEAGADRAIAAVSAPKPELASGAEMAAKLGISRTSMHRLRAEGAPAVRLGDVFKYAPGDVLAWLKTRSAP